MVCIHTEACGATTPVAVAKVASHDWTSALAAYRAAKVELDAYDAEHIAVPAHLPIGPERSAAVDRVPARIWAESQRLLDIVSDAEDILMDISAPTPAAFAFKYLVAHGGGRETDCWDHMLETEAKRFSGEA